MTTDHHQHTDPPAASTGAEPLGEDDATVVATYLLVEAREAANVLEDAVVIAPTVGQTIGHDSFRGAWLRGTPECPGFDGPRPSRRASGYQRQTAAAVPHTARQTCPP